MGDLWILGAAVLRAMNAQVFENAQLLQNETTHEKQAPPLTSGQVEHRCLDALVKSQRFLVLSLPNCTQCEELAAALTVRGVPSSSVTVKWDKSSPEYPAQKAALAAYAGASFSFPQVFVDGLHQGGFSDVAAK